MSFILDSAGAGIGGKGGGPGRVTGVGGGRVRGGGGGEANEQVKKK